MKQKSKTKAPIISICNRLDILKLLIWSELVLAVGFAIWYLSLIHSAGSFSLNLTARGLNWLEGALVFLSLASLVLSFGQDLKTKKTSKITARIIALVILVPVLVYIAISPFVLP